jgi:hypothetical protein
MPAASVSSRTAAVSTLRRRTASAMNGITGEFDRGADGAVTGLTVSGLIGTFQAVRKR